VDTTGSWRFQLWLGQNAGFLRFRARCRLSNLKARHIGIDMDTSSETPGHICKGCGDECDEGCYSTCELCKTEVCEFCELFCPTHGDWGYNLPPPCPRCCVLVPGIFHTESHMYTKPSCSDCLGHGVVVKKDTWFCRTHSDFIPSEDSDPYWKHGGCSYVTDPAEIVAFGEEAFPILKTSARWKGYHPSLL
jgi:hypothetical protein